MARWQRQSDRSVLRTASTVGALLFAIARASPALAAQPPPDVTITVVDNPGQLEERVNTLSLPPLPPASASSKERSAVKSKGAGPDARADRAKAAAPAPRAAGANALSNAPKSRRTATAKAASERSDANSDEQAAKGAHAGDAAAEESQDAKPDGNDGAAQDQTDSERQDIEDTQPATDSNERQDGLQNEQSDTQDGQPPSQPQGGRTPPAGAAD